MAILRFHIRTVWTGLIFIVFTLELSAQKQIKIDDDLAKSSDVYEPKFQRKGSISGLMPYSFSSFSVSDLENHWEKSGYWTLFLRQRLVTTATKKRQKSFSFTFSGDGKKADVVGLYEKDPEDFLVVNNILNPRIIMEGQDAFSAYIKSNTDTSKWQMLFQVDDKGIFRFTNEARFTNGKRVISIKMTDYWDNGKKQTMFVSDLGTGAEFFEDGRSIAAVQFPGPAKPRVWIRKDLDQNFKFILAAAIEVLILYAFDDSQEFEDIR